MKCRICDHEATRAFTATVLFMHSVDFFHCAECGFLQCQEPHWLDQAYADAIATADTGIVHRNHTLSRLSSMILYFLFPKDAKYLDLAGGYGLLVRMMRDVGFNFYWSDKFCENIFAKGFESQTGAKYAAVTAFEVLEHISDPLSFIRDALAASGSDSLIFSTELFEGAPANPGSWWYYAFEAGQHISFYQRRTLEVIAKRLDKKLYSNGSVHMLTSRRFSPILFWFLTNRRLARVLIFAPLLGMTSQIMPDHLRLIKKRQS